MHSPQDVEEKEKDDNQPHHEVNLVDNVCAAKNKQRYQWSIN